MYLVLICASEQDPLLENDNALYKESQAWFAGMTV